MHEKVKTNELEEKNVIVCKEISETDTGKAETFLAYVEKTETDKRSRL